VFHRLRAAVRAALGLFPAALARIGVVDREIGREIFDLAVPVMVTGGLRSLIRVTDYFMVSLALGSAAIAALEFGYQFHMLAMGFGLALSSGTISVVSRFFGAERNDRANLAIKQSLWLTLVLTLPLTAVAWIWATPLVDLLTDDPRAIDLGTTYLRLLMLSTPFHFFTLIGSRALAGVGNTRTPMIIRTTSLPANTLINAALIFGLGPFPRLGIAGAAIGTTLANVLQAALFAAALLSGRYDVRLPIGGRQVDADILREIVRVSLPLSGTRVARSLARFPFLFVLGALGTNVVAAYAIGRRIMALGMIPSWGYGTAASTLVGQAIGRDDEAGARRYGWQSVRIALATQLSVAAAVILAARPLALVFDPGNVPLTVEFIYAFGVAISGFSVGRTLQGALRGAGDTRFPFYGTMAGNYLVRLPIAAVAFPAGVAVTLAGTSFAPGLGLGVSAIYLAIWGDTYTRAVVNAVRFRSGHWMAVARNSAVGT